MRERALEYHHHLHRTAGASGTAVGGDGDAGGAPTPMEEDRVDDVQIVESENDSEGDEDELGSMRKGLSVELGRSVAKNCFSLSKIGELKAEWALRGPPTGYEEVVAWPENKAKDLQPYGIVLRKKEDGVDVFYFFCLVSALSVKEVHVSKIATGTLDKINTSNAWRVLNNYKVYSQRGHKRKDNNEKFKRLARVSRASQLRAADPSATSSCW